MPELGYKIEKSCLNPLVLNHSKSIKFGAEKDHESE